MKKLGPLLEAAICHVLNANPNFELKTFTILMGFLNKINRGQAVLEIFLRAKAQNPNIVKEIKQY